MEGLRAPESLLGNARYRKCFYLKLSDLLMVNGLNSYLIRNLVFVIRCLVFSSGSKRDSQTCAIITQNTKSLYKGSTVCKMRKKVTLRNSVRFTPIFPEFPGLLI